MLPYHSVASRRGVCPGLSVISASVSNPTVALTRSRSSRRYGRHGAHDVMPCTFGGAAWAATSRNFWSWLSPLSSLFLSADDCFADPTNACPATPRTDPRVANPHRKSHRKEPGYPDSPQQRRLTHRQEDPPNEKPLYLVLARAVDRRWITSRSVRSYRFSGGYNAPPNVTNG
jgi:hypothetical protein